MSEYKDYKQLLKTFYRYTALVVLLWTAIIFFSVYWKIADEHKQTIELARNAVQAYFTKDLAFRHWVLLHGGVYVFVNESIAPNPYLSHVPDRDIESTTGKKLTLMSHAYMMRQMMDDPANPYGVRAELTSLKPLNPINQPDSWEKKGLKALEKGDSEFYEFTQIDEKPYLRMIRPLFTLKECLKCHAKQGYIEGSLRGGLSVSIPLTPYLAIEKREIEAIIISHSLIWILALGGLFLGIVRYRQTLGEYAGAWSALRESELKFHSITQSATEGIIAIDCQKKIILWNKGAERLFGYREGEILGSSIAVLIPPRFRNLYEEGYNHFLSLEQSEFLGKTLEITGLAKDGTELPLEISFAKWSTDSAIFCSGIIRDVSIQKQREQNLQEAKEAAEAASRAKSEFLANMSHEIRTPMNGIIGMLELALATSLTSEQRDHLDTAKTSAYSLLTILNDILDFSKIEAGKLDLDPICFNFHDNLNEMFKLLSFQASQKGLEFVHSIDSDIPQFLVGNPTRLRQIIVNLVGNAIKFTPKGGVAALVKSELVDQDAITLLFIINDTGIGIPEDKQDLIFDSFMQADGAMTRQYGGTGLGLTISKRLVQMMHGNIWVDSEVGEGSSFYFTAQFGLPKVQPLIAQIKNASLLKNIPVLILDNNETTGRNLLEMLNGYDMKPQWVREIPSAIETIENGIKIGAPFKVAVIDCNLPNLDSVNMAERLKTFTEKSELKLIVLTVGGWRGDTERCRQAGISAYLTKPVNQTDLIDAIRTALRYTAQNDQAPLITRHSLRESRKNIQILLTEDNPINQKLSVAILEKKGYTVHVANNGREAIEAYHRKRYDVILMDIQMPELDGFEATEIIRQHEQETGLHVPIIAMTAHAMKGDKERCLSVGMDGYISKPVEPKTLYKIIEDFTN